MMKYRLKANHEIVCDAKEIVSSRFGRLIIASHPLNEDSAEAYTPDDWSSTWEPVPEEPHPFIKWLIGVYGESTMAMECLHAKLAKYVNDNPPPAPPPDPRQPAEEPYDRLHPLMIDPTLHDRPQPSEGPSSLADELDDAKCNWPGRLMHVQYRMTSAPIQNLLARAATELRRQWEAGEMNLRAAQHAEAKVRELEKECREYEIACKALREQNTTVPNDVYRTLRGIAEDETKWSHLFDHAPMEAKKAEAAIRAMWDEIRRLRIVAGVLDKVNAALEPWQCKHTVVCTSEAVPLILAENEALRKEVQWNSDHRKAADRDVADLTESYQRLSEERTALLEEWDKLRDENAKLREQQQRDAEEMTTLRTLAGQLPKIEAKVEQPESPPPDYANWVNFPVYRFVIDHAQKVFASRGDSHTTIYRMTKGKMGYTMIGTVLFDLLFVELDEAKEKP